MDEEQPRGGQEGHAYRVEDASLLLPLYRRLLVRPFVGLVPASVDPNTITHLGHALCFGAMALLLVVWRDSGWAYFVAAALLQAYLWCDNADGAHARRTGQCSVTGEFLDHGLDQLNTSYIAVLMAIALGAPPLWWVAIAVIVTATPAVAYWEQSVTGVFRVDACNQLESLFALTAGLVARGVLGSAFWHEITFGGLSLGLIVLLVASGTMLLSIVRAMIFVARRHALAKVAPVFVLAGFDSAVSAAARAGVLRVGPAVLLAVIGTLLFAFQVLNARIHFRQPTWSRALGVVGALVALLALLDLAGVTVPEDTATSVAAGGVLLISALAVAEARAGLVTLRRIEEHDGQRS